MVYKVNHNQTFNMLIDNPIGKEYDPESDVVSPVTTIFRKYHNKEDDVHEDIVFYNNGDVEFMDNVSMCRYTQFDHLLYNFEGDHNIVTMIHYLQFLSMVTHYGIPNNIGASMKYRQYVEEMKRAKFSDIEFEESPAEDSKDARYHISCRHILTRSATNDAGKFNCRDIFEDKPIALLRFHHKGIFNRKPIENVTSDITHILKCLKDFRNKINVLDLFPTVEQKCDTFTEHINGMVEELIEGLSPLPLEEDNDV